MKEIVRKIASVDSVPPDHVILFDARQARSKMSTVDIWEVVAELDNLRRVFKSRTAIVAPAVDFDHAKFLELCANNRGIMVRAFLHYDDAIDWLSTVQDVEP